MIWSADPKTDRQLAAVRDLVLEAFPDATAVHINQGSFSDFVMITRIVGPFRPIVPFSPSWFLIAESRQDLISDALRVLEKIPLKKLRKVLGTKDDLWVDGFLLLHPEGEEPGDT